VLAEGCVTVDETRRVVSGIHDVLEFQYGYIEHGAGVVSLAAFGCELTVAERIHDQIPNPAVPR
jgi:hypothetical protein